MIGTCIGGIRVESNSPGYTEPYLVALANAHGTDSPKTNVARYELDDSSERDHLLDRIYSLYCQHIKDEINHLRQDAEFSLTWATQEGKFLLYPLLATEPDDRVAGSETTFVA